MFNRRVSISDSKRIERRCKIWFVHKKINVMSENNSSKMKLNNYLV